MQPNNFANNLEASFCFVLLLIQSRNNLIHLLNLCSIIDCFVCLLFYVASAVVFVAFAVVFVTWLLQLFLFLQLLFLSC